MSKVKRFFSLVGFLIISLIFPFFTLYGGNASITGKVIESGTINPLDTARLLLIDPRDQEIIQETTTNSHGLYAFKDIDPGRYLLKVELADYVAVSANPIEISLEDLPVRANFSLGKPGAIEGFVVDSETNLPMSNAVIDIMRGTTIIASALTDKDGYYKFATLPPRPFIIKAAVSLYQSNMQLAVPVSNEMITINFILTSPPVQLSGFVSNQLTGEPICHAIIDIYQRGLIINTVLSHEDGSYVIPEILPGSYQIKINAEKHVLAFEDCTFLPNQSLIANFSLPPLGFVEGIVNHKFTKEPIAEVFVGMWLSEELIASTKTDENGYFCLYGLGDVHIALRRRQFHSKERAFCIRPGEQAISNFNLIPLEPKPPKKVIVVIYHKTFAHKVNRINYVKWTSSSDPSVVAYRIYCDGKRIAEISAEDSFVFKHRWRKQTKSVYEVTAVNQFGQESLPQAQEDIQKK